MIRIKRDVGYADRIRSYKIILDGRLAGRIKSGGEIELDAPPGRHRLYAQIDWCRSNTVEFENDGGPLEFGCGSALRGWRIFLALFYAAFRPDKYIWLEKKEVRG